MANMRSRFAVAVRQARQQQGLSQEALAERAGLHRTYISEVERGLRNVSLDNIEKLAGALDVRVSAIFEAAEKVQAA